MIPVAKPFIGSKEKEYVNQAIDTGWVSSTGGFIDRLEQAWASYVGTQYAVACSSGFTALILALRAAGIGKGDEVIVPEFTMVATAWAVSVVGATPVFVDCGTDLNIAVDKIEEKVTSKTKAIMPVHIYGRMVDMPAIKQLATKHNLIVIEDAAESHGASLNGIKAGAWGDLGCFSLYGNKIITAGEGGLVTTDSEEMYNELKKLRGMYFNADHTFLHERMAYNFRMSNLQAAVALAQVEQIDEILEKRRWITAEYDRYLRGQTIDRPAGSVMWMYDILTTDGSGMYHFLKQNGVESRVFFKPMSMQPMYRGDYKNLLAYKFSKEGLYLPSYVGLTQDQIEQISNLVLEYAVQ